MMSDILRRLLFSAPSLAVYVAGAVFVSRRMQRHPGPSRAALLALALLIAGWVIPQAATAVFDYRQANRPEHQMPSEFFEQNMWLITRGAMAHTALFLAGFGLLLKAVYAGREAVVVEIRCGANGETMPEASADKPELMAAAHSPGKYPPTPPTPNGFPILSTSRSE